VWEGTGIRRAPLTPHGPSLLRTQRGGCGGDSRAGAIELVLLQFGGHEDLVRAASGGSPARKGLGVEPIMQTFGPRDWATKRLFVPEQTTLSACLQAL
jgi:hypothetical protein